MIEKVRRQTRINQFLGELVSALQIRNACHSKGVGGLPGGGYYGAGDQYHVSGFKQRSRPYFSTNLSG